MSSAMYRYGNTIRLANFNVGIYVHLFSSLLFKIAIEMEENIDAQYSFFFVASKGKIRSVAINQVHLYFQ